jgi:hypothetical protein
MFHRSCNVQGGGGYILIGAVVGVYLGVCFIYYDIFLLLGKIWHYVYLQRYNSFIIFVYLNYICGIIQVYLVIGLSFQCVVFVMSGQLCHMCVLSQVYVGHILSSVCFYGLDMFFILDFKCTSCMSNISELDIRCTLIGILHFGYLCLLFPLLVLGGFVFY